MRVITAVQLHRPLFPSTLNKHIRRVTQHLEECITNDVAITEAVRRLDEVRLSPPIQIPGYISLRARRPW